MCHLEQTKVNDSRSKPHSHNYVQLLASYLELCKESLIFIELYLHALGKYDMVYSSWIWNEVPGPRVPDIDCVIWGSSLSLSLSFLFWNSVYPTIVVKIKSNKKTNEAPATMSSTNWTQKQIYVPVFLSFPFDANFEGDFGKCIFFKTQAFQ